jgi:hypothetical protein
VPACQKAEAQEEGARGMSAVQQVLAVIRVALGTGSNYDA